MSRGDFRAPPSWVNAPALACLGWNCIPPMSTFLSRTFFQELGGFLPTYAHAQDYEFFVRALKQEPFQRVGRTLAGARRHDDAMSMDRNAAHLAELEAIAEQSAPRSASALAAPVPVEAVVEPTNPRWTTLKRVDAFRPRGTGRSRRRSLRSPGTASGSSASSRAGA